MEIITQNLAELKATVGAKTLAHLPAIETVEAIQQLEDDDALSFKIFYGMGRAKPAEHTVNKIWIYLLPQEKRAHELQFVVYDKNDERSEPRSYDGDSVGRMVEGPSGTMSSAFKGVTKNRKIRALAKYYFIALMHLWNYKDKQFKTPFQVNKTWVEELKAVCLDFEQAATNRVKMTPCKGTAIPIVKPSARQSYPSSRSHFIPMTPSIPVVNNVARKTQSILDVSPASTLSDAPPGLLDEDENEHTAMPAAGNTEVISNATATNLKRDTTRSISSGLLSRRPATTNTSRPRTPDDRPRSTTALSRTPSTIILRTPAGNDSPTPGTPRNREEAIDTFNQIREEESALCEQTQVVHQKKSQHLETRKRLQQELEDVKREVKDLEKKASELSTEMDAMKATKRELLGTMSVEEQLEFAYEAGQAAGSKRQKLPYVG